MRCSLSARRMVALRRMRRMLCPLPSLRARCQRYRSCDRSGTYVKFTDSGAALVYLTELPALLARSKVPSIALQAPSASAKVLNGEPMTLTAPVLE